MIRSEFYKFIANKECKDKIDFYLESEKTV